MNKRIGWILAIALLCVALLTLFAGPLRGQAMRLLAPVLGIQAKTINYQGTLADTAGNPVDASLGMTFKLYNQSTAGTELWSEIQTVTIAKGQFSVYLGDVNPLPDDLFNGQDLYLGVTVGADSEMTPRMRIGSVPYSRGSYSASCNQTLCGTACVNLTNDNNNCGACGNQCLTGSTCVNSACACVAGAGDCDGNPTNGCEADLKSDSTNCGACSNACTFNNATGTCSNSTCVMAGCNLGYINCNENAADGCEVNILSDPNHCGTCGNQCTSGQTCVNGTCTTSSSCPSGTVDCDSGPGVSCINLSTDPNNCGACGTACAFNNATSTCVNSTCVMGNCSPGHLNCNSSPTDGCEVNSLSDPNNCGACGTQCASDQTCVNGACTTASSCPPGTANCDLDPANVCEVNLYIDPTNCGSCGNQCPVYANTAATCMSASCTWTCTTGYGDCDQNAQTGCEVNLRSDNNHCGACGTVCQNGSTCENGACTAPVTCDPGTANCDQNSANGCEVNLTNDNNNCGACGTVCLNGTTCVNGNCTLPVTCPSGTADCDQNSTNGCEVHIDTDPNNCGSCGTQCPSYSNAATTCMSGSCVWTCTFGYGDCDHNPQTGCEASLYIDPNNCGQCGRACASGQSCVFGQCQ